MDGFESSAWPRFVRFTAFTRDWERLGLDEAALRSLETEILKDPGRSPMIPGTGGLRKIRFAEPRSGRGKRGAYWVCHANFPEFGPVALAAVFGKNERADLTKADRDAIATIIRAYRAELEREIGRQEPEGGR
ncbi:MAG TPA: hypothetical protein VF590_09180 [Isosphaeraceae bacterium]|jgi:hypothetical protein